ncbi:UNVERIFIED_CONTAM: hypothetical protein GTU68_049196 [Idotea baltica]|nr:hypothetical protein [Idotea baltica]
MGVINVNKPAGITSRSAVNRISCVVNPAKAGHAGTLDPLATGVLVICVGKATRLMSRVQQMPKVYRGVFQLGVRSNTDDSEGEVIEVPNAPTVTESDIRDVLPKFLGEILQVPPPYSAIKVNGQRAYQLVRKGVDVSIPPRPVTVHRIELLSYGNNQLELEIECGSGTYIRSIGRDIGEQLKCGAIMTGLVRTRIGCFDIESAVDPNDVTAVGIESFLQPPLVIVEDLPHYECEPNDVAYLRNGRPMESRSQFPDTQEVAMVAGGQLAAIAIYSAADNLLSPHRVFAEVDGTPSK